MIEVHFTAYTLLIAKCFRYITAYTTHIERLDNATGRSLKVEDSRRQII